MRTFRTGLTAILVVFSLSGWTLASNSTNHTVTVTVSAINEISLTSGNITLTINVATAGSNPTDATNNTCILAWTVNESSKKITVASNQASPNFTLKILASGVTGGMAAAQATLIDAAARDCVTGISTTLGGATLNYTAQATAAQGTGSVVHTVTYTITAS
jgi:hypothetical protein